MYNQTKPPKYEHFPNPGDPDYKEYEERHEGNRWGPNGWGPKQEAIDKWTEDWCAARHREMNREIMERAFGLKRIDADGNPQPCPWESRDWVARLTNVDTSQMSEDEKKAHDAELVEAKAALRKDEDARIQEIRRRTPEDVLEDYKARHGKYPGDRDEPKVEVVGS